MKQIFDIMILQIQKEILYRKRFIYMKKILISVISVLMIIVLSLSAFAAGENKENFEDPDGGIVGVCARGLWHEYPENSLEGIKAAGKTGIDYVLVDVRKTADGKFVLFRDETTKRMISGEEKNISEMTSSELKALYLKDNAGGAGETDSKYKVAFLDDVLSVTKENNISLMINAEVGIINELSRLLAEKGAAEDTVLLVNAKAEDIKTALEGVENAPAVIGVKRGNVIFAVNSYIKSMYDNGYNGVVLKTKNRYGVIFHQTVLKFFTGRLRAIADLTDTELAGYREDSEKWWNDLVGRGYSVIITNSPEAFCEYLERNDKLRENLKAEYEKYTSDWTLPDFKSQIFNDYKKAYTDAVAEAERLLADKSVSTQEITDCIAALQKAVDDINANYEALENGSVGLTVSVPRICLCIGAAVVVVAVQIFFYKKRKEQ